MASGPRRYVHVARGATGSRPFHRSRGGRHGRCRPAVRCGESTRPTIRAAKAIGRAGCGRLALAPGADGEDVGVEAAGAVVLDVGVPEVAVGAGAEVDLVLLLGADGLDLAHRRLALRVV